MAKMRFTIPLEGCDDPRYPNVTAVTVPPDVVKALGGRGRIPIKGTINGFPFRTTIVVMGGSHFFVVNKEMREGAKGAKGVPADFVVENDADPRTITVPPDLAKALGKQLRRAFDAMSYTCRKEHIQAIEEAKKPETRERRIRGSVEAMRERGAKRK
jgi:hypothetical protein